MPIPNLNPQACQARNRRSALKGGLSAAPVTLGMDRDVDAPSDEEALQLINRLGTGGKPLSLDQIHIHWLEAANTGFIPCRSMFLAESTLRNIGEGANSGISFMNSHRTGGFSTESELPFGQTFWGKYEPGANSGRAVAGIFMLRGERPNGENGPTTDSLSKSIDAGTIRDVSVGLYGGQALCDLCGKSVDPWEEGACQHVPGTTYGMSAEEQRSQRARGVPDGHASYSLHNARFGEVSAVFDGAVPGAGFRKALSLAAKGALSLAELSQARSSYVAFCRDSDFGEITPDHISQLAQSLMALWGDDPGEEEARTSFSFADHSQSVLTAVTEYLERCEGYDAMRKGQDRPASPVRMGEWEALHARLEALLERSRGEIPVDPQILALRVRHLQRRAKGRENAGFALGSQ